MTGQLFGDRYQVGDTLGFGGMSEVHRGRDLRLGRDVAIKVLRADLARDPSFQTRFRREAQNAASLNHPAIVAVYDTGETQGQTGTLPYIVMEYVDGQTLRDLLKREGPLAPKRAMEIVADVCAALDFSHRHGIVHRDVKPANVMLTRAGAVKVMDFGIARAVSDGQATVTATAAVIGTAQYLSPEQARGEAVDARSDVYATGCVLYELLTGAPPFTGDSPVAVAYQHVREEPKPPSEMRPGLPKELDAIVLKALNKNPLNRYQTSAEMRSDLVRALSGQAVHATPLMSDAERTELLRAAPARVGAPAAAPAPLLAPPSILQASDDWEDEDSGRARRIWGFVGIGVVCLALLAGAIYFTLRVTGAPAPVPDVQVPDVRGMTVEQATSTLRDHNLGVFLPVKQEASSAVPKGEVISQDPSKDTSVKPGKLVTLVISEGVTTVDVPNLVTMDAQQAKDTLTKLDLQYKEEKVVSEGRAGLVEKQDPPSNTPVQPRAVVTVFIGTGPAMTVIPDVTGKQLPEAQKLLTDNHLKSVTQAQDSTMTKDRVLDQNHKAGEVAQEDTVVVLTVSNNALMDMPDLTNQTKDQAFTTMQKAGWRGDAGGIVATDKPLPDSTLWGKIVGQTPAPAATINKTSTPVISVTVASVPNMTMPLLIGQPISKVGQLLSAAGHLGDVEVITDATPAATKKDANKVYQQDPQPSVVVQATQKVTIRVSGPPPPPPTTPTASPTPTSPTGPAEPSTPPTTDGREPGRGRGGGHRHGGGGGGGGGGGN